MYRLPLSAKITNLFKATVTPDADLHAAASR